MSERKGGKLIERLRERGVLRVAASYAVIAWLVLQIADVVLEPWDLPRWVHRAPFLIALVGFPIAIALAWFFELGGGPPHRDTAPDGAVRPMATGWRRYTDIGVISVLSAVVAFFLMRDAGWLGESTRTRPALETSSLAVMPFSIMGSGTDRYVAEGLSDELRNQFSRMQSLSVTARSSSIAFDGQALDAVTIAGKLAVAALLEGTVARSGGRLQVAVQLVDGRNGRVLWADRYDRPDRDLLAVQRDISGAVVAAVLPRFASSGQSAPPPPTEDPVAYDLYLLAREKLREADDLLARSDALGSRTTTTQAADLFDAAIASDPKFAQAYANLARAKLSLALARINEASPAEQSAALDLEVVPDIERALELDPRNAEAWLVRGWLLDATFRPGVEEAYRKAVEFDPSNAEATVALGWSMLTHGHMDERYRLAMRALELDPTNIQHYHAAITAAWVLARPDEVRSLSARVLEAFPGHPRAVLLSCSASSHVGQSDEAMACALSAAARFADSPALSAESYALAGSVALDLGDDALARTLYERAHNDPYAAIVSKRLDGDVEELRRVAREALSDRANPFAAHLANELAAAGLVDEAIAVYRHAGLQGIWEDDSYNRAFLVYPTLHYLALLRSQGQSEEAGPTLERVVRWLEIMRDHGADSGGIHLASAAALAMAGRKDEAFEQAVLAADAPDAPEILGWAQDNAAIAELARDPRIESLMQRLRDEQARARARLPGTMSRDGVPWPPR
jgi:TolB-like protein/Tfp pilus assembly protein PilF